MTRDYKHRASIRDNQSRGRNNQPLKGSVGVFKWMLITALIIGFVVFLVYLKSPNLQKAAPLPFKIEQQSAEPPLEKTQNIEKPIEQPKEPQFDFYTILPKKEMIVPDHELKTRTREERIGKNKKANYVIQAGSSQDFKEADQLKAKLALMGIESKIQKAKVESVIWYRVKIGPYSQMESVNTIMSRLQKNGMKPVITEVDE